MKLVQVNHKHLFLHKKFMASKRKKVKELSCHLYQKYSDIRNEHAFSDILEKDSKLIHNHKFILNELIGICDIHPNSLFRLLYVFKKNAEYTFSDIVVNPFKYVQLPLKILSFDKAEEISKTYKLNIPERERIKAWLYNQLISHHNSIYGDKIQVFRSFLSVFSNIEDLIQVSMEICFNDKTYITLPELYQLEIDISDILLEHYIQTDSIQSIKTSDHFLSTYQSKNNITLTSQQLRAVKHALQEKFTVICGLPGTGKSTIAHAICEFHRNDAVYLLAPTGMAVNNLQNKCNILNNEKHIAGTLHKMIYDVFDKNMTNKPTVLVIDEFSMVDVILFYDICSWCVVFDCKLIIMADHQQLPPIGIGNPLASLIDSKIIKIFRLTKIKRQGEGFLKDLILRISKNILVNTSCFDYNSVHFYSFSETNIRKLIDRFSLSTENTQFISPQNKQNTGTVEISRLLQTIYLPKHKTLLHKSFDKNNTSFYVNDFVVRTVNDYANKCLYANGDVGKLTIGNNPYEVIVKYKSGSEQTLTTDVLQEEFQLAYCMTIHKVQGSQYDNVVIIIHPDHEFSWTSNECKQLLYTAVSRARKKCFFIGSTSLFIKAQKNNVHSLPSNKSNLMNRFTNFSISQNDAS